MGCALAAEHAVAKASRRLEREQVVEKAVQRALQTAVAELQHVEVSLRVSPREESPARSAAGCRKAGQEHRWHAVQGFADPLGASCAKVCSPTSAASPGREKE